MKTRQDIEDIIQGVVCALLPKMPPEDIRPAYQQHDMAGKSLISDDGETDYTGFSPYDNFMYIRVKLSPQNSQSVTNTDGSIQIITEREITFTIYGDESANIALCLNSLLQTQAAIDELQSHGLYLLEIDTDIDELHEIINEEWYERHDFVARYNEIVTIPCPSFVKTHTISIANDFDVKVIPEFKEYEEDVVE